MEKRYVMQPEFRSLGFSSAIVCEIHGITIPRQAERLEELKKRTLAAVLSLDDNSIRTDPVLEGYRAQVTCSGRSVRKFPPAAESLIKLIRQSRRFPAINVAVDAYNITVCHTRLALGVHDLDRLNGNITFRLSPGGEPFRAVGSDVVKCTAPGDYLYADDARVLAWLDSKDSEQIKLSPATRNVLIVVQGTSRTSHAETLAAIEDAATRIVMFCGGAFEIQYVA
jgi:DNA/RNA-binding domain of Phe-tRNA-synthetase-like protein